MPRGGDDEGAKLPTLDEPSRRRVVTTPSYRPWTSRRAAGR